MAVAPPRGPLEILKRLHDSGVEFVIVGGVASALHGGSRVTFNLDIVPSLGTTSWQAAVDLLVGESDRFEHLRSGAVRRP